MGVALLSTPQVSRSLPKTRGTPAWTEDETGGSERGPTWIPASHPGPSDCWTPSYVLMFIKQHRVRGWGGWADFLLRADWVLSVPKIPCPALCDFGLYQRGVPTSMLFQDGLWLRPWEPSCKQGVWCPAPEGENQARSQLSSRSKRQRSHLFFPFTF